MPSHIKDKTTVRWVKTPKCVIVARRQAGGSSIVRRQLIFTPIADWQLVTPQNIKILRLPCECYHFYNGSRPAVRRPYGHLKAILRQPSDFAFLFPSFGY